MAHFKPPPDLPSPEEAAHELLGPGRPYDQGGGQPSSLAVYDPALVSIPELGSEGVVLASRLPDDARKFLVDFQHHLLLNEEEWGHETETGTHVELLGSRPPP